jgi:hypothetical protein
MRPDWPPHRPRFPHRHISEPYVPRQLPGAVVSEASRQSGLSSVSIASDASSYAQHALGFKHCAAPVGPRHTGTWRRWKKRRPPSAMATLSDVTAPRGPPLAEAAQGSSHRAAGTGQLAQGSWHRAARTGQLAQGSWHRAAGTGQLAQGSWHRGCPGRGAAPCHGRASGAAPRAALRPTLAEAAHGATGTAQGRRLERLNCLSSARSCTLFGYWSEP